MSHPENEDGDVEDPESKKDEVDVSQIELVEKENNDPEAAVIVLETLEADVEESEEIVSQQASPDAVGDDMASASVFLIEEGTLPENIVNFTSETVNDDVKMDSHETPEPTQDYEKRTPGGVTKNETKETQTKNRTVSFADIVDNDWSMGGDTLINNTSTSTEKERPSITEVNYKHQVTLERTATQYSSRMQAIPSHHKERACFSCGYCIQYLVYVSWIGRFFFCIIGFLPFVNYTKDLWICGILWKHRHEDNAHEMWFWITLSIFWASSRVLWMIKFDLESMRVIRLPFYIIPGSVALDFKLEEPADWAVWFVWELLLFTAAPFSPLLLLYNAMMKVLALFGCIHYDGQHTLAFNITELGFETIPQLCIQSYLHFKYEHDVSTELLLVSIIICLLSLVKIPMLLIWNRSLIHGLEFKRHHTSVVKTVRFHPQLDILASGSWDMTVLFHTVLVGSVIKAKRVAPCGSMQVNCIDFNHNGSLMAVGGHGLRIYDVESKQYIKKLPKRKNGKRPRGDEMSHISFTKDGQHLVCAEGTMIVVYDVDEGTKTQRNCIDREHDSICAMALSPDNAHIITATATGKSINVWKVSDLTKKDKFHLENLYKIENAHMFTINCIDFTKDGSYFFTGSTDSLVKLWNFEDPQNPREMKRYQHSSGVSCLSVGVMPLSDVEKKEMEIQDELAVVNRVKDIDEHPDQAYCTPTMSTREVVRMGKAVLVTGGDHTVTIWDLISGERINQYSDIEGAITGVHCSPFGDNLAFCTDNKGVELRPLAAASEESTP